MESATCGACPATLSALFSFPDYHVNQVSKESPTNGSQKWCKRTNNDCVIGGHVSGYKIRKDIAGCYQQNNEVEEYID